MTLASHERAIWLARNALPHEPHLRAWLSRRNLAGLEVDDIVQETYAILAALERVDHIQTPHTYMFEVAKSVVLRTLRRSRIVAFEALAEAEALEPPCPAPSPEIVAADRQELGRIAALIAGLRKVHGLSQREVALRMGVSENTVEKHVGKGIGVLMNALGRGGKSRPNASRDQHGQDLRKVDNDQRDQRRN
jgi:RNA polymerase sigma factor (sigma-70 family)